MPVAHHSDDPWASTLSKRGIPGDELVSALQKYIRRGALEGAILVAREMFETSHAMEEHLWTRLLVISASDCGDGTFSQTGIVDSLYRAAMRMPRLTGEHWLFVAHATRYLTSCSKDMTTDELCMWTVHVMNKGKATPQIPDYALDVHTRRGQELGRDVAHFLAEGTVLTNEYAGADSTYRERVREIVARGEWND